MSEGNWYSLGHTASASGRRGRSCWAGKSGWESSRCSFRSNSPRIGTSPTLIYRKIKTSQGNIFMDPMASGVGLTDLILTRIGDMTNINNSLILRDFLPGFTVNLKLKSVWIEKVISPTLTIITYFNFYKFHPSFF